MSGKPIGVLPISKVVNTFDLLSSLDSLGSALGGGVMQDAVVKTLVPDQWD